MTDTVVDTGGTLPRGTDYSVTSIPVSGGTLFAAALMQGNTPQAIATAFAPTGVGGGSVRFLSLTNAKADTGVAITGTATGGAFGVARTAGTSLVLLSEATSGSAKTNKAFFEVNLPDSYVAGANIPVQVTTAILGTGTLTAASCTLSVAGYTELLGVEAALTVSAAQTITAPLVTNTFTITGTGLTPGQHLGLEIVGLITSSSGANTLEVAGAGFQA